MKKTILTSVMVLGMLLQLNAQSEKINFGVKAGVNFANGTGSGTEWIADEVKSRIGLLLGGIVEYALSEKFSLQGELLYSMQGFQDDEYDDEDYKLALNYINIPILAKYEIANQFSLFAGPQVGFLVAANTIEKEEGETDKEDWKEYYKSTDLGLSFGGSYEFNNHFGLDLRYTLGFTNIIEDDDWEDDLKNRVLSVSLFYKF